VAAAARHETTELLAREYGEAWEGRDVEAILALHTADSVFHVHGAGEAAVGTDALRTALEAFYAAWHQPHFTERRLLLGQDHWVLEWTLNARAAGAISGDGIRVDAQGASVSFEGVDVITLRDGFVASKDVYIDALAVRRQLEAGP
jgi:ketosteroid isomerase-like protein